jgi:predicted GIY-YIG superfamily endonuclease
MRASPQRASSMAKAVAPWHKRRRTLDEIRVILLMESERFHSGITGDLKTHPSAHNAGTVIHTARYRPWHIKTFVAFADESRGLASERYLKSGLGRPFAKARL